MGRPQLSRIAVAQTVPVAGDLPRNLRQHLAFIAQARAAGAQLLLFPELSLSGYDLPRISEWVTGPDDPALSPLRAAARQTGMLLIAGAPVHSLDGAGICIGSLLFTPDGQLQIYRKQHLHPGEEKHVVPGPPGVELIPSEDEQLALAICADTTHASHASQAAATGATIYAASVFWTPGGYGHDAAMVQQYAREYSFAVLVANYGGPCGGFESGGQSACWAPGGQLVAAAPAPGAHLLVLTRTGQSWRGESQPLA